MLLNVYFGFIIVVKLHFITIGVNFVIKQPALEKEALEASTTEFADSTLFKGNICGPIASTMDESMFKLVISKWQDASEDLKKTNNYKFMSAAGSLMKNMVINTF